MVSDTRVAQILTDELTFTARVRQLWTEAGQAGDMAQVRLCQQALAGDQDAREACAIVLAEAEAQ